MASMTAPYSNVLPGTAQVRVPWTIWLGVLGVTSASIGGAWDVAWHRSIGRDSFLTPAHLAIYACGVLAALVCGYLIFATTFGRSLQSARMKSEAVTVFGFQAPLGAFLAAWGGIAMLTSAPFDNWWHAAYGLDVKIVSPPHTLLILGIRMISIGVLFLILAAMNRASAVATGQTTMAIAGNSFAGLTSSGEQASYRMLQRLFLYMGGLMVTGQMFFIVEYTWDVKLHSMSAYMALGIAVPIALAVIKRASGARWACTTIAAIYTVFGLAEILLFPLIPATPKLGPVFFNVTHLVPMKFPILIVLPALAMDLLWNRLTTWKPWQIAAVSGVVFTAILFAVEWPFASFLLSKASENRFFGTIYFDYNSMARGYDRMRLFFEPDTGRAIVWGLLWASVYASISTWVGFRLGNWMRGVQR